MLVLILATSAVEIVFDPLYAWFDFREATVDVLATHAKLDRR